MSFFKPKEELLIDTQSVLYVPPIKTSDPNQNTAREKEVKEPVVNVKRIYIGNLDPTVTEYRILKIFGKYGKIAKIDYLWHKHGPKKGAPRGYCFLEYERSESCQEAIQQLHGTVIAGRKLVVSFSFDHMPEEELSGPAFVTQARARLRRDYDPVQESVNTKVQARVVNVSTDSKIAALERKLQQIQRNSEGERKDPHRSRSHPYKR